MNERTKRRKGSKYIGLISTIIILALIVAAGFMARHFFENMDVTGDQDPDVVAYFDMLYAARDAIAADHDDQEARLQLAMASFHLGGIREALHEIKIIEESGNIPEGVESLKREIGEYRRIWDEAGSLYATSLNSGDPSSFYPDIHEICDDVIGSYDAILRQRAVFLKAHTLLREGRKDEALVEIEQIVGRYLNLNDYCQYYLGRSLATQKNIDDAIKEFDLLQRLYPGSRIAPLGLLEQVNIFRDQGKIKKAKAKAQLVIDKYPESTFAPIAHRKLAEIYERSGDADSAAKQRYTIIDGWPETEETRNAIASLKEDHPRFEIFTPAQRLRLLEVLVDRGMYDYAEPLLGSLRHMPTIDDEIAAGALYNLARIYYHRGKYDRCIAASKDALNIDPTGPWSGKAYNRLGHAYRRQGKITKALNAYEIVAQDHPDLAPYALYNAGRIYISKGNLNSARVRFTELGDRYPGSSETQAALNELFLIAYRSGDYSGCLGYCDKLIDLFPDGKSAGAAHFWRAKTLGKLGRMIEASQELTYMTTRFQRSYYGIRALEILGASGDDINRLIFRAGSEAGSGITGGGPKNLDIARELLRANVFDLALDEFAALPEGISPEAFFAEVQNAYLSGNWHGAYKTARDAFSRGYGNLLSPEELYDMLIMRCPMDYQDVIKDAAERYDLDPSWLNGVILQESTFNAGIMSHADAIGLMQIMPDTGRFIAHLKGLPTFDTQKLYEVDVNMDYGAYYLDYLRDMFNGDLVMILIAYNGGPGNARTWKNKHYKGDTDLFIESIPASETRDFVKYVYTNIRLYKALAADEDNP